jgi:hypothetical protein
VDYSSYTASGTVRSDTLSGRGPVLSLHLQSVGRSKGQLPVQPSLQEKSFPAESTLITETQEKDTLAGLLIKANRITGGTSSNQRQL